MQSRQSPYPDFYIVGAPKCGTTAFYDFLAQHPDLYLPDKKELLFFGSDLSYPTRLSEQAFLAHFEKRGNELRAGTAHTAYLQSRLAAHEIHAKRPDADILILLRNPVELVYSWHSELLYETIEDIQSFESAIAAEPDRKHGRRVPSNARNSYVESLFYTEVALFSEQVERYFDTFGPAHVHVVIHDDLVSNPGLVYRDTLTFLGVDATFVPDFAIRNANKVVKHRLLQRLYFRTSMPGHAAVRRMIPSRLRQRLLSMNVLESARREMAPELRSKLQSTFRADVARLSVMLNRDLSSWTRGE